MQKSCKSLAQAARLLVNLISIARVPNCRRVLHTLNMSWRIRIFETSPRMETRDTNTLLLYILPIWNLSSQTSAATRSSPGNRRLRPFRLVLQLPDQVNTPQRTLLISSGKLQKYHTFQEYFQKCHPHISKIPHRGLAHPGRWAHQPHSSP